MRTTKKWATREQHEREILKPDVALKSVLWRSLLRDNSRARQTTVGQNQVVLKHLIINFPTSLGASERASERICTAEQREQCGASEWLSGGSERANGRASGSILSYSRPDSWLFCPTVQTSQKELLSLPGNFGQFCCEYEKQFVIPRTDEQLKGLTNFIENSWSNMI